MAHKNKLFIPAIMPVLIYGGDDLVEVNITMRIKMQQLSFMFLRLIIQNFVLGCPGGGGRGRITFRRKH